MFTDKADKAASPVAPVRERGLKYHLAKHWIKAKCRSRKGAWIEIMPDSYYQKGVNGRSRKGAWIEIFSILPLS